MAQKYFGTNIPVASGFDIAANRPLDPRTVVETYSDLATIPAIQLYAGLTVYIEDEEKSYFYNGSNWKDATAQGLQGADGEAATIQVGQVTTGEAGSNASVTNSGTENTAIFDFTIPRGATGAKGDKGDKGDPFTIKKTYASVSAMNDDFSNGEVPEGSFVMIDTGNVEDEDNAKLYVKGAESFTFITDLSGATGLKGDPGDAATIQVGDVTTGEAGSSAKVENKGTTSAAIFNFIIPKGDKGDQGTAATIQVGEVTTVASTEEATVTNSGTENAAVFDFEIPKGEKGDTGEAGAAATVSVGSVTTGEAGTNAQVTNAGNANAAVFNFTIPRGADGATGADGAAATITVGEVTTLEAGEEATVTNSGTENAAVLDFSIPKGEKGDKGDQGDPGKDAAIKVGTEYATATDSVIFFKLME